MLRKQMMYKAALRQLEKELDLEWKKAEKEQDEPKTRILGRLRMKFVLDRSRALDLMKLSRDNKNLC
jgi:hypothetical protein